MGKKKHRPDPASLGLPRVGVDSHAHLDMDALAGDLVSVLERAGHAGVARIGNVFLGPWAYEQGRCLFEGKNEVFFVLGIHPHDALKATDDNLAAMEKAFRVDGRIKALGETGLDFYRDWSPFDAQRRAFKVQLELARERDLRVVIHSREADAEVMRVLENQGFVDRPVLWHCFGGGPDTALAILERGWTLSIPGTVTYPKNIPLQEAVAVIPLTRMVLETDCPYLTPEPYRGKRNEPALTVFTAAKIAELKGLPIEHVWERTGLTAVRFFGLDESTSLG